MGKRILLIKPSSLGDIIHALPTAAALKRRYPDAHLAWLVKKEWAEILYGNPDLDEVLAFPFAWFSAPGMVRALRSRSFDWVVDLQGLLRSGILGWMTSARRRVGFSTGREGSPLFYTERIPAPDPFMHAVDRYLLIARALDASVEKPIFRIPACPDDAQWADASIGRAGEGDSPRIVLNSSARRADKRWPVERFADVGRRLAERFDARLVVIGGPEDLDRAGRLSQTLPPETINLAGRTSLGRLAAVLRRADFLVTNDSGPMHLAAAVQTPVVAIFGPTDPRKVGPYGSEHRVLEGGGDVRDVTVDQVDAAASWLWAKVRVDHRSVK